MTIPDSLRLCFAFWDRSELIANDFVAKRARDLSLRYLNSCFSEAPRIENTNIDLLLKTAAQSTSRWCLVQSYGHMILRFDFYQELERLLPKLSKQPFLVMGHILDRKSEYYELHNQCFLVDLDVYRRIGMPAFGLPARGQKRLERPIRSPDNFHDDYTPPWLRPAAEHEHADYEAVQDGWSFIEASLRANLEIPNFPHELRQWKQHLYPEAFTSNFERALRNPDQVPNYELNDGQRRFLSGMRQNWSGCRSSIFLFNTDDIVSIPKLTSTNEKLQSLYAVAAGFRATRLLEANGFDSKTVVTYFDYSGAAIEFRQKLVEQFDGENFIDFLRQRESDYQTGSIQARPRNAPPIETGDAQFAERMNERHDYDRLEMNWKRTQDAFGGKQSFKTLWQMTRQLTHRFVEADLFDTPSTISNLIQKDEHETALIWWSNSFSTEATHTFMPLEKIERAYQNFEFVLRHRRGRTLVDGTNARNGRVLGLIHQESSPF